MGKATDFTGATVGEIQVGDRTTETKDRPLSMSRWNVQCSRCEKIYTSSYVNLYRRVQCVCTNPWRIAEERRMKRLKSQGLR